MKKTVLLFVISLLFIGASPVKDCKCKNIPLYGRVRVVDIGEDFRVRVVDIGEDLQVQKVDIAPDQCGKWQFVDIGEDFKIRFVDIGEDFKIRFVDACPGIPPGLYRYP